MKEREEKGKMDAGDGKRRQQEKRPRRRRNREERGEGKEKLEREKQMGNAKRCKRIWGNSRHGRAISGFQHQKLQFSKTKQGLRH